MYLFIGERPLRLRSRASLGRSVGSILLALTLLILRILRRSSLDWTCSTGVQLGGCFQLFYVRV